MLSVLSVADHLCPWATSPVRRSPVAHATIDPVVGDLVRFVGYGTLKIVTRGSYRSDDGALFLEGGVGLFVVAGAFALVHKILF